MLILTGASMFEQIVICERNIDMHFVGVYSVVYVHKTLIEIVTMKVACSGVKSFIFIDPLCSTLRVCGILSDSLSPSIKLRGGFRGRIPHSALWSILCLATCGQ